MYLSSVCAGRRHQRRERKRELPGSTRTAVRGMLALVGIWRERRRARRHLAAMSERELQDIGTCRSEIGHEIGKPFWKM